MKSFTQIGREENTSISTVMKYMNPSYHVGALKENTSISTVMRIFHDIEVPHKELDYEAVYLDEFRLTNSSD